MDFKDFKPDKFSKLMAKSFRYYSISMEEWQKRFKESEWIGDFLSYCEKNDIEKNITYMVPKNSQPCPCIRFKNLYSKFFKKIQCLRCDIVNRSESQWETCTIPSEFLKEYLGNVHKKPI